MKLDETVGQIEKLSRKDPSYFAREIAMSPLSYRFWAPIILAQFRYDPQILRGTIFSIRNQTNSFFLKLSS